jgi:hypothetical protein
MFTRCVAPDGIHALIPGVVCDNVTPSLAQVQYFLGMARCLAGMTASGKRKWSNLLKQQAPSRMHESPEPLPFMSGQTSDAIRPSLNGQFQWHCDAPKEWRNS